MSKDKIELGDVARDRVTGLEGTVVGITHYINNCDGITLQPHGAKDGKAPRPPTSRSASTAPSAAGCRCASSSGCPAATRARR